MPVACQAQCLRHMAGPNVTCQAPCQDHHTQNLRLQLQCTVRSLQVLSVEYPLAPEHQFPAAVVDTAAAYAWLRQQLQQQGSSVCVIPGRIAVQCCRHSVCSNSTSSCPHVQTAGTLCQHRRCVSAVAAQVTLARQACSLTLAMHRALQRSNPCNKQQVSSAAAAPLAYMLRC